MIRSYLKIAWRSLANNKAYSIINISGLSIAMCSCLLILQYVSHELSFDRFHQKGANIYRVRNDREGKGELVQKVAFTYPFVAPGLKKSFPEVHDFVRIAPWIADHTLIKYGDKVFREKGFLLLKLLFQDLFVSSSSW